MKITYDFSWFKMSFSICPLSLSEYSQGLTECQQSKLSCTNEGDFLSAQEHPESGRWLCVSPQGEELSWTSSDGPLTVEECKGMCYSQC